MKFRYFIFSEQHDERLAVPPDQEATFFELLEAVSGLERTAIEDFLHHGIPIRHEGVEFYAEAQPE